MLQQALHKLRTVFGYEEFRPPQDQVINALLHGKDVLVLMPTGGGKSLCYQLPALVREGTAIVVSPLIALMQDQVQALSQLGIQAAFLNSTLNLDQLRNTEKALRTGELDLLYIAPERLLQPRTLALLESARIALFAIDEAHCVSQWGHDFRPEYLQLSTLHECFPAVPRIALTATADQRTRDEIVSRLALEQASVFVQGFDRPNIRYSIRPKKNGRKQLLEFINKQHRHSAGIVYCLSRKKVEETASWLQQQGFNALPYHAGLSAAMRSEHQHRFLTEEEIVICATVAFGMGIDKPNVRFVAHLDLPRSIEAYYQETGRAGRDGEPADAWMVYGLQDVISLRQMLASSDAPDMQKQIEQQRLESMLGLCEITSCRRQSLLSYFGEPEHQPCGNCDSCLEPPQTWDGTEAARKALSAVYRTGQRFGVGHVIDVLTGKLTERVRDCAHDRISTWAIGKDLNLQQWRSVFRQLVARGYLIVELDGFGVLRLSERCRPLLKGQEELQLRRDEVKGSLSGGGPRVSSHQRFSGADLQLWEALRELRRSLASDQDVPPYVIFHDATLMEMVEERPGSLAALSHISGVGKRKLELYGEDFMVVLRRAQATEGLAQQMPSEHDDREQCLVLTRAGMTVEQVAYQRGLDEEQVYQHLLQFIARDQACLDEVVDFQGKRRQQAEQGLLDKPATLSLQRLHKELAANYPLGLLRCLQQELKRQGRL